jgi:hypothetical protein
MTIVKGWFNAIVKGCMTIVKGLFNANALGCVAFVNLGWLAQ